MKITMQPLPEFELYQTEQADEAMRDAQNIGGNVYSWLTTGTSNWLEFGYHWADVLGLVVLPAGYPHLIELASDGKA